MAEKDIKHVGKHNKDNWSPFCRACEKENPIVLNDDQQILPLIGHDRDDYYR